MIQNKTLWYMWELQRDTHLSFIFASVSDYEVYDCSYVCGHFCVSSCGEVNLECLPLFHSTLCTWGKDLHLNPELTGSASLACLQLQGSTRICHLCLLRVETTSMPPQLLDAYTGANSLNTSFPACRKSAFLTEPCPLPQHLLFTTVWIPTF